MKKIQILANSGDSNEFLKAVGVNRIYPGWYSVWYNGVQLGKSTIVRATRNRKGIIINKD